MKQYCRYCAYCFQADENEFRCSDHPKGKQPHWTRQQINRENHCPNFVLSDLGDAETEQPYRPRNSYHKKPVREPYEQIGIDLGGAE